MLSVKVATGCEGPRHTRDVEFRGRESSSVTVKLDRVDRGVDGATSVASSLLLCLFVAERFALGKAESFVGFLAPVAIGTLLKTRIYAILSATAKGVGHTSMSFSLP